MPKTEESQIKSLAEVLTGSLESDVVKPSLDEAGFGDVRDIVREVQRLAKLAGKENWKHVPPSRVNAVETLLKRAKAQFTDAAGIGLGTPDLSRHAANLRQELGAIWHELFGHVGEVIAVRRREAVSRQIEKAIAGLRSDLKKDANELSEKSTRLLELIAAAETQFEKTAVSTQAKHFEDEAKAHAKWAKFWLVIALAIACLLARGAFWVWDNATASTNHAWDVVAQRLGAKVLLASLITSLLVFAIRNYSASRHNVVINSHRARALRTFQVFAESPSSPETRDAVLLQATKAIFAQRATGYLKSGDSDHSGLGIPDLIKLVSTKQA